LRFDEDLDSKIAQHLIVFQKRNCHNNRLFCCQQYLFWTTYIARK